MNIEAEHIGYGPGPLTWLRQRKHKRLRRKVHICLLEHHNPKGWRTRLGKLTAFWINERSYLCSASLNERIEDADIVWVYSEDPLAPDTKDWVLQSLEQARVGAAIINSPSVYDSYHQEHTFEKLTRAGVSVPRTQFSERDVGRTWAIYKAKGQHGAPKLLSKYAGPKAGYRALEFVDSRGPDGLYRVYRAFYIAGIVRQTIALFSEEWNVSHRAIKRVKPAFTMTPSETKQIHVIADVLCLKYFAVDYLRRKHDDLPIFTDINVYPHIKSYPAASSLKQGDGELGYYGRWLTFDRPTMSSIPDPLGRPFWEVFDEAMLHLSERGLPKQQGARSEGKN